MSEYRGSTQKHTYGSHPRSVFYYIIPPSLLALLQCHQECLHPQTMAHQSLCNMNPWRVVTTAGCDLWLALDFQETCLLHPLTFVLLSPLPGFPFRLILSPPQTEHSDSHSLDLMQSQRQWVPLTILPTIPISYKVFLWSCMHTSHPNSNG